jgi:anthranilate phosphoribosyltransferase
MKQKQTSPFDLSAAIARLVEREDLTREQSRAAIAAIMAGEATPAQVGAFLVALRMKGETVEEIAGGAEAMREAAARVPTRRRGIVDTCGTGGDGKGTRNISTAAALVAAGGGVAIAKHGNRAVSSRSGSADLLEALGVRIDLDASQLGACLDEVGIAFLFAPVLHPAMRHAVGPRREIRVRTLFNLLGPLTNPAGVRRQVLGVFSPRLVPMIAKVLAELGAEHSLVVHGPDGEDELVVGGKNLAMEVRGATDSVREITIDGEPLGLSPGNQEDLLGGDARENADWCMRLLRGEVQDTSRETVILNAAAAFYVAGLVRDLAEGCQRARESINSGAALRTLERLREVSRKL